MRVPVLGSPDNRSALLKAESTFSSQTELRTKTPCYQHIARTCKTHLFGCSFSVAGKWRAASRCRTEYVSGHIRLALTAYSSTPRQANALKRFTGDNDKSCLRREHMKFSLLILAMLYLCALPTDSQQPAATPSKRRARV